MILLPLTISLALIESPNRPAPVAAFKSRSNIPCAKGAAVTSKPGQSSAGDKQGVAGLPFAHGRSFCTLDEYLAHLEKAAAPIDQPWWKEVRPGVFQHISTGTSAGHETATRAELMKRFGFSR